LKYANFFTTLKKLLTKRQSYQQKYTKNDFFALYRVGASTPLSHRSLRQAQ